MTDGHKVVLAGPVAVAAVPLPTLHSTLLLPTAVGTVASGAGERARAPHVHCRVSTQTRAAARAHSSAHQDQGQLHID